MLYSIRLHRNDKTAKAQRTPRKRKKKVLFFLRALCVFTVHLILRPNRTRSNTSLNQTKLILPIPISCRAFKLHILRGRDAHPTRVGWFFDRQFKCRNSLPDCRLPMPNYFSVAAGDGAASGEGDTSGAGDGDTSGAGDGDTSGAGDGAASGEGDTSGAGDGAASGEGDTSGVGDGAASGCGDSWAGC